MDNLNYNLDNYSQNDLCDMFDIKIDENFDKTILNNNYNKMITNVKSELHIPDKEKENILKFLDKAFKKLLEKDAEYKLTEGNFMPNLEKNEVFSRIFTIGYKFSRIITIILKIMESCEKRGYTNVPKYFETITKHKENF